MLFWKSSDGLAKDALAQREIKEPKITIIIEKNMNGELNIKSSKGAVFEITL